MSYGQLPFNVEAEEAILGAVIIDPATFTQITLTPSDFYIERHQWIWEAMTQLHAKNQTPDFISLSDQLSTNGKLDSAGGPAFLTALINRVPTSLHADQYAGIIQDKSRRRKAIQAAGELTVAAFDEQSDLDTVSAKVTDQLTSTIHTNRELIHISEIISQVASDVEERAKNPSETYGVPTGFIDLDRMTGGVSGLWYLGGEPGIGKSILMLQIIINAAKRGKAGALFTLEMSNIAQMTRALSAEAKIPTSNLRTGKMNDNDWEPFYKACEEMADLPVYICDEPELTTTQLRAQLTRYKARINVEIFGLDYLYLMADQGSNDATERTELLSKRVKAIQRKLNINGITVNSVTKEGMNNASPKSTSLRGSGQLIHDADVVLFISKHDTFDSMRTLSVTKGRDLADSGSIHLIKTGSYPSFQNAQARQTSYPAGEDIP